ncbi:YunG family protein [Streptomyces sp. WMMC905]|uniref:YunG family protein n=1 Tax=Streptomyces sp. WMMC905 TaxID=3404123 RepID=UPI003B94D258
MTVPMSSDVERAVLASRGPETRTSEFRAVRARDNPSQDQCGVTAMVLNDPLGEEPIRGEVRVDGVRVDFPWWNRLGMGVEIDLKRGQFEPREVVAGGVVVPRPPWTNGRLGEEDELLRDRVMADSGSRASGDTRGLRR